LERHPQRQLASGNVGQRKIGVGEFDAAGDEIEIRDFRRARRLRRRELLEETTR